MFYPKKSKNFLLTFSWCSILPRAGLLAKKTFQLTEQQHDNACSCEPTGCIDAKQQAAKPGRATNHSAGKNVRCCWRQLFTGYLD